jgi:cytoplasmic FMR1 interacting protein
VCFNKFLIHVCQHIYVHFRIRAARMVLAKEFKAEVESIDDTLFHEAFLTILKLQSIQILGRNVNINQLISAIISKLLRKSIDIAIGRFESQDLGYLIEFEKLLQVSRVAHQFLSTHVQIDSFNDMLMEMDESVSLLCNGRIVTHLVHELINDFVANYCFNSTTSRFIRASIVFTNQNKRAPFAKTKLMHLYGSKDLSIAFGMENISFRDVIDDAHFESILRLVGLKGLLVLSHHLTEHAQMIASFNYITL